MLGSEIFIPKIKSYKILDLLESIRPDAKYKIVGIRNGEKLHEEMINSSDAINTYDIGKYYVILPNKTVFPRDEFIKHFNAKLVDPDFSYNSRDNNEWENVDSLRDLIKKHVDINF